MTRGQTCTHNSQRRAYSRRIYLIPLLSRPIPYEHVEHQQKEILHFSLNFLSSQFGRLAPFENSNIR
jgi:hypothetical protein